MTLISLVAGAEKDLGVGLYEILYFYTFSHYKLCWSYAIICHDFFNPFLVDGLFPCSSNRRMLGEMRRDEER